MNNYSQNNFKPSKTKHTVHVVMYIVAAITFGSFIAGIVSALLELRGY